MGIEPKPVSLSSLYRTCDRLVAAKEAIEQALVQRESALHAAGIHHHWTTLRTHLSGQVRVTTSMLNDKGQVIHLRHTSEPEPMHLEIDHALGVKPRPLKRIMTMS